MAAKPILVTGGAGYIGSHTCKRMAENGWLPVVLDNLTVGHKNAVQWGPFIKADIRDTETVTRTLKDHNITMVMHFAASAYVGESVENPSKYYDNNVGGMISLLKACRMAGADKFILSSSCATYGIPATLPITEDTRQVPINPYGRTKLMCEEMLRDFATAYSTRHVILRYFNACGADPDGILCENHTPETHIIPLALMAATGKTPPLQIFGTDYETTDGTCVRDYIHVVDLAEGHVLAASALAQGGESLAVNLGSGTGLSLLEILQAIHRITGLEVPVSYAPRRAGDPPALLADPTMAKSKLGFNCHSSDIETIIRTAAPNFGVELPDAVG